MSNLKQHLENKKPFILSEYGNIKYNAVLSDKEQIKKEGGKVIYSIYFIDERTNTAKGQNRNAWGVIHDYILNTNDISIY